MEKRHGVIEAKVKGLEEIRYCSCSLKVLRKFKRTEPIVVYMVESLKKMFMKY